MRYRFNSGPGANGWGKLVRYHFFVHKCSAPFENAYQKMVSNSNSQRARMAVHGRHQGRHMLGRGVLADAVAQIEDVGRAGTGA